ncbi:MAG: D-alanyl-D-alanine carboxypeptidase/D-alanyl-D-alanine-endopeptidase [Planctomycetota bacterium]
MNLRSICFPMLSFRVLWLIILSASVGQTAIVQAQAFDPKLAAALNDALQPGVDTGASVAVRVLDADTGEVLLETPNADDAFIPASNMKLVTSATALDLYGPKRQLVTSFTVEDQTLVITAGGDPAFGDPALLENRGLKPMDELDRLADKLIKAGISHLPNGVLVIDAVFDQALVHPSWHPANLLHWYGAPVAGVSFNDNCIDVTFKPTEPGQPAELEVVPPAGDFVIRGQAITAGLEEHSPELAKLPDVNVFQVGGKVGRVGGPYSKPVQDPRVFLGSATAEALRERGIQVADRLVIQTEPLASVEQAGFTHLAETPLLDVLGRVNTNSQNMMAEAVAKLSGLAYDEVTGVADPRGSWESGHRAAVDFLRRIEVDASPLVAADGSGLSRDNRVSAGLISDLLMYMLVEHEHGEHFVNTMAISGVRGSVRNRMGKNAMAEMKGRVYAKTGTIRGVSALSGYVFHDSGRVLVFSILHNDIDGSQTPYRRQQDEAVAALWRWLDSQPVPSDDVLKARPAQLRESLEVVGVPGG